MRPLKETGGIILHQPGSILLECIPVSIFPRPNGLGRLSPTDHAILDPVVRQRKHQQILQEDHLPYIFRRTYVEHEFSVRLRSILSSQISNESWDNDSQFH